MPPPATRARAPFPMLLGLGAVLFVMAVVLAFLWLNAGTDMSVCASTNPDSTMGDCLLSGQLHDVRADLMGGGAVTLFAGSIVAAVVGLAQLVWDRRR